MTDAQVGRLLVAALHQAITDELPTRIDFYEHWLRGERLRDGGVGVAPMIAVLGFLRAEGPAYHAVMRRAGRYAGEWTYEAMPGMRRRVLAALPRWWRSRAVLRVAAQAIRDGYGPSRTTVRVSAGKARVEISHSLFCRVRDTQSSPQCDFHAAMIHVLLDTFRLASAARIDSCVGVGGSACAVTIDLAATAPVIEEAA